MLRFAKGHGTENDFVLLPDLDDRIELTPDFVRALCDRRSGIGGDGVLRIAPAANAGIGGPGERAAWFMDYRNADGSIAEMCGNGIRVYARYLVESGLAQSGSFLLATRDGDKRVHLSDAGDVTVEMGPATVMGPSSAIIGGRTCLGTGVDMGNPHLVCAVDDDLQSWDLTAPPVVDRSTFPDGVNVEIVSRRGDRHVAMRVHERGAGETRSCGTGACAVAVAASRLDPDGGTTWTVDVPGGRLSIDLAPTSVRLTGPAVIVANGVIDDVSLVTTTLAATQGEPG